MYDFKTCSGDGEYAFWLFFFIIIAIVIPLIYYFYTKNKDIMLGYFFFTGFFFTTETLQTYGQVMITIPFLIFFLSKNFKHKFFILLFLLITWFIWYPIHSQQLPIMIFLVFMLIFEKIKGKFFMGATVFWPIQFSSDIRTYMTYPGTSINLIASFVYYIYHFFFKNMLFMFSIPAVYNIIKEKNWYEFLFFGFIFFGAIAYWIYEGFNIWRVTRVLIWLPIVLLPSFMRWLEKQSKNTQKLIWVLGALWFLAQCYIYLLNKVNIFYD